jgi:hypothetical protein
VLEVTLGLKLFLTYRTTKEVLPTPLNQLVRWLLDRSLKVASDLELQAQQPLRPDRCSCSAKQFLSTSKTSLILLERSQ